MKKVSSRSNPLFKDFLSLTKNQKHRDYIIFEGQDLVVEADAKNLLKYVIICDENQAYRDDRIPNVLLHRSIYRELASFKSLPSMIGVATIHQAAEMTGNFIYLDGVQDPGNVGTIIRTALALNYDGLMLSPDSAFPFSAKVVQASKGAIFKLPIKVQDLRDFPHLNEYEIVGTSLGGDPLAEVERRDQPLALVFGNEGHGIKKEIAELLNKSYLIPMSSIDSLNVSVAAGIFMYIFRENK